MGSSKHVDGRGLSQRGRTWFSVQRRGFRQSTARTSLVDGQEAIHKSEELPSVEQVVTAVKDRSLAKQSV